MEDVKLNLNDNGQGAFTIMDGAEKLGEMVVGIAGNNMTVYHTEVAPKAEGKGLAKNMLAAMVAHARAKNLKVTPLCPYVHAQFMRHPDDYADLWNSNADRKS